MYHYGLDGRPQHYTGNKRTVDKTDLSARILAKEDRDSMVSAFCDMRTEIVLWRLTDKIKQIIKASILIFDKENCDSNYIFVWKFLSIYYRIKILINQQLLRGIAIASFI